MEQSTSVSQPSPINQQNMFTLERGADQFIEAKENMFWANKTKEENDSTVKAQFKKKADGIMNTWVGKNQSAAATLSKTINNKN